MTTEDALSAFRHLDEIALAVHHRTGLWNEPLRLMRVTSEILEEAPAAVRVALAGVLGRGGSGRKLPRWLSTSVQRHLTEFSHLYALGRVQSNLYTYSTLRGLTERWAPLVRALDEAGVGREAIEQLDRYMSTRLNFLMSTGGEAESALRSATLTALGRTTQAGQKAARKLIDAVEEYAAKEFARKGLSAAEVARIPFGELGPFGKLQRLLPGDDPAWRELGAWVVARTKAGSPIKPWELQGVLGEIVALRTPGVVEFLKRETGRVLALDPSLGAQGWRVMFQPRTVTVAKRGKEFEKGAQLAEEGLAGSGQSFDVSVWLVKDAAGETPVAMPVARVQVKAGTEETVLKGVDQGLVSDEWRMFSDTVTLDVGRPGAPKARNYELRPPDTFNVIRVLVGADVPDPKKLLAKMPKGTDLAVFGMPLSGGEFGMIGGVLSRMAGK